MLFHATPGDDNTYLMEQVRGGRSEMRPATEVAADLAGIDAGLVRAGIAYRAGDELPMEASSIPAASASGL